MVIATLFKVTVHFKGRDDNDVSTWHCGSYNGALRFIDTLDNYDWYSIEGQEFRPCHDNDPMGQLYIGLICFDFHEVTS